MKKRIVNHPGFSLLLFSLLLVLLNCNDSFQTPDVKENDNIPAKWGTVRLMISDTHYTSARTIFPQNPLQFFSAYRLAFTPLEEQEKIDDIKIPVNQNGDIKDIIALEIGEWEITAFGIIVYEEEEREIAKGSVIITVIADTDIEATIVLQNIAPDGGMGTFTWNLIIPQDIATDTYSISLTCWEDGNKPVSYTDIPIEDDGNVSGSAQVISGYYLLRASIGIIGQEAFYFEVVHIGSYRTSSFEHIVKPDEFLPVSYTVHYDKNAEDAVGATDDSVHSYGVEQALTANGYTRKGYSFIGWNTQTNGEGTSYTEGQIILNLASTPAIVTFYAQWIPNQIGISIAFDFDALMNKLPHFDSTIVLSHTNIATQTATVDITGDYDSLEWEIHGVGIYSAERVTGTTSPVILDATNMWYNSLGWHTVEIRVIVNKLRYQTSFRFRIIE